MEPLNLLVDIYQVERKPTLKPPVVQIFFFQKKSKMFQINDHLDITFHFGHGALWFEGIIDIDIEISRKIIVIKIKAPDFKTNVS